MIRAAGILVLFEDGLKQWGASVGYVRIGARGMRGMTGMGDVNRVKVPLSSHNGWLLLAVGQRNAAISESACRGRGRANKDRSQR